MKKIQIILLSLILLSCETKEITKDKIEYKNDSVYIKNTDKLYTGKLVDNTNGIKIKVNIKKGKINGEYISVYENGNISVKTYYKDGKKDGEYVSYYEDGNIYSKCNYNMGKLNGKYISYYENGNVLKEIELENNNFSSYIEYYENGNMKIQLQNIMYKDEYTEYYENGNLKLKREYTIDGILSLQNNYDENNNIISNSYYSPVPKVKEVKKIEKYNSIISPEELIGNILKDKIEIEDKNVQESVKILYNEEQEKLKTIFYFIENDKNVGMFEGYPRKLLGTPRQEFIYRDGIIFKVIETVLYPDMDGKKDCSIMEINIVNGMKNGKVIEKGKYFKSEYTYVDNLLQGNGVTYFLDGRVLKYLNKDGKRDGKAVLYYPDGTREEFVYKDGITSDEKIYYNKLGEIEKLK
ncbi:MULTISPECIES: hypothetical protein [Fusobacterium]|uniref:hypothetical protein n=1 Tax=Fusobacterium TaxID=848 RepID=UPI001476B2F8|nr:MULTISPECIES: hypothetical protein [Fusobacterium]NME36743.1 hypothetical protein [Fusobacterium sp. FSA-380-WT-3A]